MMMDINKYNRKEKSNVSFIVILFAIIGLLFIGVNYFLPHIIPGIFSSMISPYWRFEFALESGSLRSPQALLAENETLRRQLSAQQVRMDTIHQVELENSELKVLFGRDISDNDAADLETAFNSSSSISISSSTKVVQDKIKEINPSGRLLAAVLVHPPLLPYDELIIDVGADFGLTEGDKIYTSENVPIGFVSSVQGGTSKVLLFSSPGQKFQVLVGPTNILATAEGRGGGQYSALLPRSAVVSEGDFVVAPSLNDKPYGIVRGIISDPAQPFATILFTPPVSLYNIRWVLVEKSNK